jgi:anti-sigma regulatory factor (Ser/Thr protein kinase)
MELYRPFKLIIPNDINQVYIVLAAVAEYAGMIGFRKHNINKIRMALEESIGNIIRHSYLPDQDDEIEIQIRNSPEGIIIRIKDHGLPIEDKALPGCDPVMDPEEQNGGGFDLCLAHKFMDKIVHKARGYKGNLCILKKYYPDKKHPDIHPVKLNIHTGDIPDNKANYIIRLMQPDEAQEVSRLAYLAYHYSYPFESIYMPSEVRELNMSGKVISAVAASGDSQRIISHLALELPMTSSKFAEIGIAFTNPEYRGYGCINRLTELLINNAAKDLGLFGVFCMAVTSHPFSQKSSHKHGMKDCALLISRSPALEFEKLNKKENQRESLMIALTFFKRPFPMTIYPPSQHRNMTLEILDNLGVESIIGGKDASLGEMKNRNAHFYLEKNDTFRIAKIKIHHYGKNILEDAKVEFFKLKVERFETIYIYLNLSDPCTQELAGEFEKLGFFIAGLVPEDKHIYFVLQYLNNQVYVFDSLQIDSGFGQKLMHYVRKQAEDRGCA